MTEREAHADLVTAVCVYLERRDAEGKYRAGLRLREAVAQSLRVVAGAGSTCPRVPGGSSAPMTGAPSCVEPAALTCSDAIEWEVTP